MKYRVTVAQPDDDDPIVIIERDGLTLTTRVSFLLNRFQAFQDIWVVVEKANQGKTS